MRQFTMVAAVAIAALISAAPASAERINGGPIKQNGQCWRGHASASEATWGYWKPCAEPASGFATERNTRGRTQQAEASGEMFSPEACRPALAGAFRKNRIVSDIP
jgi:opacity protein-like surface antigen